MTAAASAAGVAVGANPFSRRAVLAIVVLGSALFVALLWMIGTGTGLGTVNDGQAHAGSKGLTGYAAMADFLDRRGFAVSQVRGETGLDQPGLLVLTPPASADGREIDRIVTARRRIGPTLVVTPKWVADRAAAGERGARPGWVRLDGTTAPMWPGFLDDLSVVQPNPPPGPARWRAAVLTGRLPAPDHVMYGGGTGLVQLVAGPQDAMTLAGFLDDGGRYPGLEAISRDRVLHSGRQPGLFPLVVVFEPDLLNNYGMADLANARLAESLVRATGVKPGEAVAFDLTLNGYGRSANLLTLAFTPPFLAATLCLLLAAVISGWRAALRFGPPLVQAPAIAFGKRALVANAAGLVRRSRRLHLLADPYADGARERLVRALGLPRALDAEQAGAAIDRACAARQPDHEPFTTLVARLKAARRPHDLLIAARDLCALERMLIR